MSNTTPEKAPSLPPRWVVRIAWAVHRGIYRVTGGRRGLWQPTEEKFGTMLVTTIGRKTGNERSVILGYFEDGPNLVTLAMNGWGEGDPAWWLNLKSNPEATIVLTEGVREVRASQATGSERARLWARWQEFGDDVEGYSKQRSTETSVVVLEPR